MPNPTSPNSASPGPVTPNPADHTRRNARLFGAVAPSYDRLGFLALAARFVASGIAVKPGMRVLDIATGTGEVALALAARGARVTGLDLSPEMIEQAQAKAQGQPDIQFVVGDAAALPFADGQFDVVVCAAGLFFMPDMAAALCEWRRVLRGQPAEAGGLLVYSSFGRGLLGQWPGLWREELAACGLKPPAPPLGRIPTPEAARDLLLAAGLVDIQAGLTPLPYKLTSAQARWDDIVAGLEGAVLPDLPPEQSSALGHNHLARLEALPWPQTVPIPVIVAQGRRGPAAQKPATEGAGNLSAGSIF